MATDYAQMRAAELLRRAAGAEGIADVLPDAMITRMRELGEHAGDDGPVFRYLDCSTGNITQEEANALSDGRGASIIPHEYGAMVRVPAEPDETDDELLADWPNVARVVETARALGCSFVNFDADGETLHGHPTFDW